MFTGKEAMSAAPITLTIPWDVLVPDNAKYGATLMNRKPRLYTTTEYKHAHKWIYEIAMVAMKGSRPLQGTLALKAVMYEPNRSRVRDLSNYCKLVHDGLSGEVYDDDGQLDDVQWIRGGVDKDNPRVEITVSPLLQPVET